MPLVKVEFPIVVQALLYKYCVYNNPVMADNSYFGKLLLPKHKPRYYLYTFTIRTHNLPRDFSCYNIKNQDSTKILYQD